MDPQEEGAEGERVMEEEEVEEVGEAAEGEVVEGEGERGVEGEAEEGEEHEGQINRLMTISSHPDLSTPPMPMDIHFTHLFPDDALGKEPKQDARKRKKNPEDWAKNMRKKQRATSHETGPDCRCKRFKCFSDRTTPEDREVLIAVFNQLGDYNKQQAYLASLIDIGETKGNLDGRSDYSTTPTKTPEKEKFKSEEPAIHPPFDANADFHKGFADRFGCVSESQPEDIGRTLSEEKQEPDFHQHTEEHVTHDHEHQHQPVPEHEHQHVHLNQDDHQQDQVQLQASVQEDHGNHGQEPEQEQVKLETTQEHEFSSENPEIAHTPLFGATDEIQKRLEGSEEVSTPKRRKTHTYTTKFHIKLNNNRIRVCQKAFCSFFRHHNQKGQSPHK